MKLGQNNNLLVSNHQGTSENFGIGDVAIVIDILRNRLYTKKITTMAQEYICNARDAAREAGKADHSFIVTAPTHLNPVFKVRDFGIGVSPDRMSKVFIQYGASTKRSDNNATGGFGLGAKIGFAVSDSFSIVTYIDGTKRTYVAHVGKSNEGQLDLVSTEKTTEKNGTEIQVPIQKDDIKECRDAILRATYFWNERPEIKGVTEIPSLFKGYKVNSSLEIINKEGLPEFLDLSWNSNPVVLVDGMPYQTDNSLLDKCEALNELSNFVIGKPFLKIGNGVIEVAASRETIADSPTSVKSLEKLAKTLLMEVRTLIASEFGKVNSVSEYIQTYRILSNNFTIDTMFNSYSDYSIQRKMLRSEKLDFVRITRVHRFGRRNRTTESIKKDVVVSKHGLSIDSIDKLFVVNSEESVINLNKRIRGYFASGKNELYLLEAKNQYSKDSSGIEKVVDDGFASLSIVADDLKAQDIKTLVMLEGPKKPKNTAVKDKSEFCVYLYKSGYEGYKHYLSLNTLNTNEGKFLYIPLSEVSNKNDLRDLADYLSRKGIGLCGVSNKTLKIIEGNENFSSLKNWLDSYSPSVDELKIVMCKAAKNSPVIETLKMLKGIKDKVLTDGVNKYRLNNDSKYVSMPEVLIEKIKLTSEYKTFIKFDENLKTTLDNNYSLLYSTVVGPYSNKQTLKELLFYVNSKFESKGE